MFSRAKNALNARRAEHLLTLQVRQEFGIHPGQNQHDLFPGQILPQIDESAPSGAAAAGKPVVFLKMNRPLQSSPLSLSLFYVAFEQIPKLRQNLVSFHQVGQEPAANGCR